MKDVTSAEASTAVGGGLPAFGPFRLDPKLHILWEGGSQLRLGSRAREILTALVERAGETVGKNELVARVWPTSVVEESTLRVHIATLRRILGDGRTGIHYVQNVSGQGYRFIARVSRMQKVAPPTRTVERTHEMKEIAARVPQQRLVSITGAGGIGKTTLALGVADRLAQSFPQGACFVDLAVLAGPGPVSGAVASALGLPGHLADPLPEILKFLRRKSMLMVLDNCEHVIEAAASFVERVLQGAPGVHVLATSREPLRAQGECVCRLDPLAVPGGAGVMTRLEAMRFPSLRLFIERAEVSLDKREFADADMPAVAQICRRLDGNPLAIESAASYVNLLGVTGLAASLEQGLHLMIRGRRTAAPRHQTLRATLDWSYELLSDSEQTILRRLAVFAGSFDLQSAKAVATDGRVAAEVFECLVSLAAKSLIATDATEEKVLYRLLDTPRAYLLEKLRDSGELAQNQRRYENLRRQNHDPDPLPRWEMLGRIPGLSLEQV